MSTSSTSATSGRLGLGFATLGIVFGDIGTSPIYAFRESFEVSDLRVQQASAYGVASIVFWALIIVISAKYLTLVMRADNHGEGGILALASLVMPENSRSASRGAAAVVTLGVFGTALLYGDGLITPAISVLSAVEGFEVATSAFSRFVVPVAIAIIVALFAVQRRGTEGISKVFSPVMLVWFVVLGLLGLRQIVAHPGVLRAVSPSYGVQMFLDQPTSAFLALGSIFLVVTGGEALYADMGHFGRRPITVAWYGVVLPGLLLTYFGQAALLAERDGGEVGTPFYDMAPSWGIVPLAILATCATVIASQALISGAFSLTAQAVRLDYFPRIAIRHTSAEHAGQVYVPLVNWLLMTGCVALILVFRTSTALAAAYGIAVTTTMLITTIIFARVVRERWGWSRGRTALVLTPFLIVDLGFLAANVPKIPAGGWFPLLVGCVLALQMTTWRRGRELVTERLRAGDRPLASVLDDAAPSLQRAPGTAVYLFRDHGNVPPAMAANLRHHHVLHEQIMLVSVETTDAPHVGHRKRAHYIRIADGIIHVKMEFGFLDEPNVPLVLAALDIPHFEFDVDDVVYFLGRESVTSTDREGMHPLREELFVLLHRGAANAARFFRLPPGQVCEVGAQIEL